MMEDINNLKIGEAKKREIIIRVNSLYKYYKVGSQYVHALDGLDFTIKKGEFCAIVGPSGSGKSTLLNICLSNGAV